MKKIFAFLIVTLLAVTIVDAQDGWITHKGDNRHIG